MLVCAFFCANCTRDRGCSAHPAFPAPSVFEGGRFFNSSGAWRREDAELCSQMEQRHCEERSDEAIHSSFTRKDGLLRFARNDGLKVRRVGKSYCVIIA